MDEAFREAMQGYGFDEPSVVLGGAMQADEVLPEPLVRLPLSLVNRHGLIAGATGTGKTKTLQLMAGQLSEAGVPVFVADVKGDLTGLSAPGDATDAHVAERLASLGTTMTPAGHPLELLSLSGSLGAQVRATVSSFGPLLLSRVLDLNETQTQVLTLVFQYCDDHQLALLDLADLREVLKFVGTDEGEAAMKDYGGVASATVGVIARSMAMLESQGARELFGEPEFDVNDLLRTTPEGKGVITALELSDVMDRPALFSTFMLWLLAQLYHSLPEVGDLPQPKVAFFFDEAHLLFEDASDALMEQIELTARLIRSKGVGVYFVTQAPTDVPPTVLSQLGNRVQHALRAFTPQDAEALAKTVKTFPVTEFYDVGQTLQSLGIGEALVTVLSPKGVPTPLAATRLIPPDSRMAAADPASLQAIIANSPLTAKYSQVVDRESAKEILTARLQQAEQAAAAAAAGSGAAGTTAGTGQAGAARPKSGTARRKPPAKKRRRSPAPPKKDEDSGLEKAVEAGTKFATSSEGQKILRGVLGSLFK